MTPRDFVLCCSLLTAVGCGHAEHDAHAGEAGEAGGHHHNAIHEGGVLVELGDHFGQLEAALDAEAGTLTLWLWDGHLENSIRLADEAISVEVTLGTSTFDLDCAAQASALTGETVGNSSEFMGTDERLKGAAKLIGRIRGLKVKGVTYKILEIQLPPTEH